MRTFFGRPYALLHTAFCLTFGATLATAAKAMPDSTDQARAVPLFVGHLNFDAIPDTVYGWADARQHYLPHSLHWGRVPSPGHAAPVTTILYPDWQDFSGTVAFQQMNADTVAVLKDAGIKT